MSESQRRQEPLLSFDFNHSVKLRKESPDITLNAGVLLLREADHKLGITASIAGEIFDLCNQDCARHSIAELLRERLYAIAAEYACQGSVDILRGEMESARDFMENPPHVPDGSDWDMSRFRSVMLTIGSKLSCGNRRLWPDIAEGFACGRRLCVTSKCSLRKA